MTKNLKIGNIIVRSIVIYMMNFYSAFTFYANRAFRSVSFKSFFSIFNSIASGIFAFIAAIGKCMGIPIIMIEFFFTCLTNSTSKLSCFAQKITRLRAENFIITCDLKLFLAMFAIRQFYREFSFACKINRAFVRAKSSLSSISFKLLKTKLTNFMHSLPLSVSVYCNRHTQFKQGEMYG